ncbi:DEAD/DEAH box helicase [Aliarcobacter cryaerophilus]|uniref:DEAD/DEAH box helicase n=1 Tax=Aliarcobacter cryaerophilus TaxID=28198 RepID=UPI0021B5D706|nr:DEAD/DEAH box helicase [Aliarcobacter cryaerophilus]MCT7545157.1 DEAD/DEAH box helicase [Aliarcobacter cryaerophilus]
MELFIFKKPYPYQQDIIDKTIEFKGNTLIQLPTGGGKTLISYSIAIELCNKYNNQILFIAPKINLMEQTLNTFKNSKPQKIHKNTPYDKNHPILISTIQTASRRDLNPDVIIIDEIHYGFDGKMIENLIKDKPNIRIIGLSATPYDRNGRLLQGFDLVINKYDMKYMIENEYLVPLESYVLVRQNLKNVKLTAGDYNLSQLSKVVSNNNTILEIIRTSKEFIEKSKKTIVFAVDINHCELLTEAFKNEGFNAKSLHSNNDRDEFETIENFKKGYIKVLVSVLKLTTGFDVPDTDLAIIARPTKSQILYKQMVGRVLRKAPNKKIAILLDCGNVIEELGDPLEPIKENFNNNIDMKNKTTCSSCNSGNIKLRKKENNYYWECLNCNSIRELENKNLYKCSGCEKSHTYKSNFIQIDNKLFLNCDCNSLTLVSQYYGNEEFVEFSSSNNYSNKVINEDSVDLNNIVKILINNRNEAIKDYNNFSNRIEFTNISEKINEKSKLNHIFYSSLCEEDKLKLDEQLKLFLSICTDINNSESLDLFFKNLTFNAKDFLNYFNQWNEKEIDKEIAQKLEYTLDMNNLKTLIKLNIITLDSIIELTYKLKLYKLIKEILIEFNIKDFTYYMNNDELLWDDSNFYIKFNEEYFSEILPLLKTIDIAECFDIIGIIWNLDEYQDKDIIIKIYNIIHSIQIVNSFIKKFDNVKNLIFGRENKIFYLTYVDAKKYIKSKNIKKLENWVEYTYINDFPIQIPKEPKEFYKQEWECWNTWLNSNIAIDNLTYDVFDEKEWQIYNYLDTNEFIYCFKYQFEKFLDYKEAKLFVHSLNLTSIEEWEAYKIKPDFPTNIPKSPNIYYSLISILSEKLGFKQEIKSWSNWNDWLGLDIKTKSIQQNIKNKSTKNNESNSIENFSKNSRNKLLKIVHDAQKKYPNDSLYFSQLNSTISDYFDKSKKIISSHNLNENDIRKRAKNFEKHIKDKLKLYK